MNTATALAEARSVLTPDRPCLWIMLTKHRTVAAVKALPIGESPNPEGVQPWVLVGDCSSLKDKALERAILAMRCALPNHRRF